MCFGKIIRGLWDEKETQPDWNQMLHLSFAECTDIKVRQTYFLQVTYVYEG
jgi:hypothetical protein